MLDRLERLNPLGLDLDIKNLPTIQVGEDTYRVLEREHVSYNSGSCQCFGICDCFSQRGKVTRIKLWYRNIKLDDTDKCFYSQPYTNTNIYKNN